MKAFSSAQFFPILHIFLLLLGGYAHAAAPADDHRAYFVFGDSLVDHGNNNYLFTTAQANKPPYGIDFPTHNATGRFSNGLSIVDIIGEYFGIPSGHPYLKPDLNGEDLLHGANFASAGVGILNDTGLQFFNTVRIDQQLHYFKEYQRKVKQLIGHANTRKLMRNSITLISLGANDFLNNYYLVPNSLRYLQFSPRAFSDLLISEYRKILKKLNRMGARKIIVTGTGPIGCVPAQMALHSDHGECVSALQESASIYNHKLTQMLMTLNRKHRNSIFIASHTSNHLHMDLITNPAAYGFETSTVACCGQGPYNGIGPCTPLSSLCKDRDKYVFWDAFHPTERAIRLLVNQMIHGSPDYIKPMNLSTMKAMFFK